MTPPARDLAACQCAACERYLAADRVPGGPQLCNLCAPPGAPSVQLARIRGPESLPPAQVEALALLAEESAEVVQRVTKTLRWGWAADYQGSTMREKLEAEVGDLLAMVVLAAHNGVVTRDGVTRAMAGKLSALREDADGPRQRVRLARVPQLEDVALVLVVPQPGEDRAEDVACRRAHIAVLGDAMDAAGGVALDEAPLVSRTSSEDVPLPVAVEATERAVRGAP